MKRGLSFLVAFLLLMSLLPLAGYAASSNDFPIVAIAVDKSEIKQGESITATWSFSGGGEIIKEKIYWSLCDEQGNWTSQSPLENTGRSTITPTGATWAVLFIELTNAQWEWKYWRSTTVMIAQPKEKPQRFTQEQLTAKVKEIAAKCKASASTAYARAKWLHDYLADNAIYDYSFTYYNPEGVLLAGKGVCQSFAEAYQLLLKEVGIPNRLVSGKANNSSGVEKWEGHAWNLVQIDGNWYHVDVTWDETGGHKYFLKSDDFMRKDHRWSGTRYPAPYSWGEKPAPKVPGDANADTFVDMMDLQAMIDHMLGVAACASPANADADGKNGIDAADLVFVINTIVK